MMAIFHDTARNGELENTLLCNAFLHIMKHKKMAELPLVMRRSPVRVRSLAPKLGKPQLAELYLFYNTPECIALGGIY